MNFEFLVNNLTCLFCLISKYDHTGVVFVRLAVKLLFWSAFWW